MKRLGVTFIFLCLIGCVSSLKAQRVDKLLTTSKSNFLFKRIYFEDNRYVIPFDYADGSLSRAQGSILFYDPENNELVEVDQDSIDLGLLPMVYIDDIPFMAGGNTYDLASQVMTIRKLNEDYTLDKDYEFGFDGINGINLGFVNIDSFLYLISSGDKASGENSRYIQVWKVTPDGELVWSKLFGENITLSATRKITASSDDGVLIAFTQISSSPNISGLFNASSVYKIDSSGHLVWHFLSDEETEVFLGEPMHDQLSDGRVILSYIKEYPSLDKFNYPPKLVWLSDQDGSILKEKTIITDKYEPVFYKDIEAGKGDYFFAYGKSEIRKWEGFQSYDRGYAHLVKYNNEGDTLWVRNYNHKAFSLPSNSYDIQDILEHDDGTLSVFCKVKPLGSTTRYWLFKVNADGCFFGGDCENELISTAAEEILPLWGALTIYPNPASDYIQVKDAPEGDFEYAVVSIGGTVIDSGEYTGEAISTAALPKGMYTLLLTDNKGGRVSGVFKKL